MFKKILVAVDGSPCADRALELALRLVKAERGTVTVCSVAYTSVLYGSPQSVQRAVLEIREEARHVVAEALSKGRAVGITAQGCTLVGEPVHQIVSYAKRIKADAIVIGTHGRSGVKRLFTGSVAEGVLRSAPMPVLTVRVEATLQPLASSAAS